MGRRSKKKQQIQHRDHTLQRVSSTSKVKLIPFPLWLTRRVLDLPRFVRILITAACSMVYGVLVIQLVYGIYLENFFSTSTYFIPTLVAFVIGISIYILGWRFIVGTVGERPDENSFVFWYIIAAVFAGFAVIVLFLAGYTEINTA